MELPAPDRWDEINALLAEAHAAEDPDAVLAAACEDDEALRREVETLLDAASTFGSLFDEGAAALAQPLLDPSGEAAAEGAPPRLKPGEQVGAYRLIEQIGEGGTSVVYRAERADDQFERTVAIKVLRGVRGQDEQTLERFQAERQILASLSHPHLADVYDGGVLPEGRPYLVMEYVDGRPLTEHCRAEDCSLDERLSLFRQAAEAVQAAHEQLVVHRDLKPSNVLVERDTGQVKLLDFGIAKMLGELPGGAPSTQTGRQPMTPAYAAPEQVKGEPISVATDTYALGVLLYELLTDARPYGSEEQSPYAVARAVCEEEPPLPSEQVDDERRLALRGDLNAIVMTALRKVPDDRYDTVDELIDDLERYQDDRPVRAQRGGWGYRAKKFVRRNQRVLATTVIALVLLTSFVAYHVRSLSVERTRARQEAETAEQVTDFLVRLFEASNPAGETSETVTARDLLKEGQRRADRLHDQPAAQAQMLTAMGRAHQGLGNYETADSLFREALSLRKQQHDAPHPSIAAGLDHLSRTADNLGRYAVAESLAQEATSMWRSVQADPTEVAQSLHHLGLYKKRQGERAPAESLYREALTLRKKSLEPPHRDLAATYNDLGQLYTEQGDHVAAESLNRKALSMRQTLFGTYHPKTSESHNNLAMAVERQGRYAEAESLYQKTLEIDRTVLGPKHPFVASDLNNLAVTLEKQGQYAVAESLKRKSLALRRQTLPPDHPDITASLNNLAVLLRKKGNYAAADSLYRRVLRRHRSQLGEGHPRVGQTLGNRGDVQRELGNYGRADSLYRTALSVLRTSLGDKHPLVAVALEDRADLREVQARYADAERWQREALKMRRSIFGPDHPKTVESLSGMADLLMKQGDPEGAESLYREAVTTLENTPPSGGWKEAYIRSKLGASLLEQGAYSEAKPLLQTGYRSLRELRGPDDEYTRRSAEPLAALYEALGKTEKAEKYRALANKS